jgi:hypothetical protein
MLFKANDLVECIVEAPIGDRDGTMPRTGRRYTVESVHRDGGVETLRLVGQTPSCRHGGACACGECGWDARLFRRVYRPKDANLDVFREMLDAPVEPDDAWEPGMAPRGSRWGVSIPPRLMTLIEEALRSPAAPRSRRR